MSSAPDCASLKAKFPAVFVNRRRLRANDPNCKEFIHLVGTCEYNKSPRTGNMTRFNTVTIGRIFGDQPKGVGKIEFNKRFLLAHPEYTNVDVYHLSNHPGGVLVVPKGTTITAQDLAQAVYEDIRSRTNSSGINGRDQVKITAVLERAQPEVDAESIKARTLIQHRKRKLKTAQAFFASTEQEAQAAATKLTKAKLSQIAQQQKTNQLQAPAQAETTASAQGAAEVSAQAAAEAAAHNLASEQTAAPESVERISVSDPHEVIKALNVRRKPGSIVRAAAKQTRLEQSKNEPPFELSRFLTQELTHFPELKAQLSLLLAQRLGPDYNFLKLPWHLSTLLPLPCPKTQGRSVGASACLNTLLEHSAIAPALTELTPNQADAELMRALIITAALNANFKFSDLKAALASYELPYEGQGSDKMLSQLDDNLTIFELESFWRAHNEAIFKDLKDVKLSEPMLLDVRLAAPYDSLMEASRRRALAQQTAEMLITILSETEAHGTDATPALNELDAQAAQLASSIATTLTAPNTQRVALQLAALALPQVGALCYGAPYEGELTGTSSVLYAKGLSLCPENVLPSNAMSVAAPLLVMARPDLSYSMLLSHIRTWRAQGQRLLMEIDPLSTKMRQLIACKREQGKLESQHTITYHGMKLRAIKLKVSWQDLYGLEPNQSMASNKEQPWYLYLYCNEDQCQRLQHIMEANSIKVNEQYQNAIQDLMVATAQVPSGDITPIDRYISPNMKIPMADQVLQCFSDQSTDLNTQFVLYCAGHSFRAVLSSENLDERLVFAASEQRQQLEQRVRALCLDDSSHHRHPILGPWAQLGSLVALLGQELYESLEQRVVGAKARRSKLELLLPDNSVELMLMSLATITTLDQERFEAKSNPPLSRKLNVAERNFLELIGIDPEKLLGANA